MKKCIKCMYENENNATVCANCYSNLEYSEQEQKSAEEFFEKYDKKQKRAKTFKIALMWVYFALCTIIFALTIIIKKHLFFGFYIISLVLGVVYYLGMFHTDTLFKIEHITVLANFDNAQPSDRYNVLSVISAYVGLIVGIIVVSLPLFLM